MKKFLLLSSLALCAFAAKADYSDFFEVEYDNQPVENNATVICTNFEDNIGMYKAEINFVNKTGSVYPLFVKAIYTGNPTVEQVEMDPVKWGIGPQICETNGSCFNPEGGFPMIPADGALELWFEIQDCLKETVSSYILFASGCVEDENGKYIPSGEESEEFRMTINFGPSAAAIAGVENIGSDFNAPVYYNLQGVRVAEPGNGIYIVKQGDKVSKTVIRK